MRQLAFFLVLATFSPEFTASQHRPRDYRDRYRLSADNAPTVECPSLGGACPGQTNLLSSPGDFTGGDWLTFGSGAAAPTVSAASTTTVDGVTVNYNRVQYASVSAGQESSLYQVIPGHYCATLTCTYSIYLRAHAGGASSGFLPIASAQNNSDGTFYQFCPYTSAWSRCVLTFENTGGYSYFWTGYTAASGAGAAMDLDLAWPKAEEGSDGSGASAYACPSPLQDTYSPVPTFARTTADWGIVARDGAAMFTAPDGSLIMAGGWNPVNQVSWGNHVTTNEVLRSTNRGATWSTVLAYSDDPPQTSADGGQDASGSQRPRRRHMATWTLATVGGVEYFYLFGGDQLDDSFGNPPFPTDVWRSPTSSYGATWERMTNSAEYGSRVLSMAWAIGSTLYVAGGQTDLADSTTALNDVWKSVNGGATWTLVTAAAPWGPRGVVSGPLPTFAGRVWMAGGGAYGTPALRYNDVWSYDGTTWVRELASAPWSGRYYHNAIVYKNRLWVMRGVSASAAVLYDSWYSEDGVYWHQYKGTTGGREHASSAAVTNGHLVLAGGTGDLAGQVWDLSCLSDAAPSAPVFSLASPTPFTGYSAYSGLPATDGCKDPATITTTKGVALSFSRASASSCCTDPTGNCKTLEQCTSGQVCISQRCIRVAPGYDNLLWYSEQANNGSGWASLGGTRTADQYVAPDDTTTGDKHASTSGTPYAHGFYQNADTTTQDKYNASVWARCHSGTCAVQIQTEGTGNAAGNTTCEFTGLTTAWSRLSCPTGAAYGVGLTRITVYYEVGANQSVGFWGMQLSAGADLKPYIKTVGGTATAAAETASFAASAPQLGCLSATYIGSVLASGQSGRVLALSREADAGFASMRVANATPSTLTCAANATTQTKAGMTSGTRLACRIKSDGITGCVGWPNCSTTSSAPNASDAGTAVYVGYDPDNSGWTANGLLCDVRMDTTTEPCR